MSDENDFRISSYYLRRLCVDNATSRHFLYAFILPVDKDALPVDPVPNLSSYRGDDPCKMALEESISTIGQIEADELKKILHAKGILKGHEKNYGLPDDLAFKSRPSILQFDPVTVKEACNPPIPESPAPFLARVESFVHLEKKKLLLDALESAESPFEPKEFQDRLSWLLTTLKNLTGLEFPGHSVSRIGNIEFFNFPLGSIYSPPPVDIRLDNHPEDGKATDHDREFPYSKGVEILRRPPLDSLDVIAHVVLRNGGEVVLDQARILHPGEFLSKPFLAAEPISEYEVRLFVHGGAQLVYYERVGLMRDISFRMAVGSSGRRTIHDKFSQRLISQRPLQHLAKKITNADSYSSDYRFSMGAYKTDPWIPAQIDMRKFIRPFLAKPNEGRWFPGGLESEADAFLFLRDIAEDGDNAEVILADPYFDETAFSRWLMRLRNKSSRYVVITSFGSRRTHDRNELVRLCQDHQALLPPHLTILDVVRGPDQVFHDRYLARVAKDGDVHVHLLSSSLNKAAGDFAFCAVELDEGLAREVYYHLRDLMKDREISEKSSAGWTVDVLWEPMTTEKRIQKSKIKVEKAPFEKFPFWSDAIIWLLGLPNTAETEAIIAAAIDAGFLSEGHGWYFREEHVIGRIQAGLKAVPTDTKGKALQLAIVGELLAHSCREHDMIEELSKLVRCFVGSDNEATTIMSEMARLYEQDPSTKSHWGDVLSVNDLTAETIYRQPNDRLISELYQQADSFLDYSFGQFPRLYGLQYSFLVLAEHFPNGLVAWLDHISSRKVRTAAINFATTCLSINRRHKLARALLFSEIPFFRMLGASYLNRASARESEEQYCFCTEETTKILKDANFIPEDIAWIVAWRLTGPGGNRRHRNGDSVESETSEEADRVKEIGHLAHIWPMARLSPAAEVNFETAIQRRAWHRFEIAQALDTLTTPNIHPGAKALYERCVGDVESLLARGDWEPCADFHFFGKEAFEDLYAGAKSFVMLRHPNEARAFRNREWKHIVNLIQIVMRPFSRRRNFQLWNSCVGRGAAGLLYGFWIAEEGYLRSGYKSIEGLVAVLLENVRCLFLGEQGHWNDHNALLDRLVQEGSAVSLKIRGENATDAAFEQIVADDRLPQFLRAHFSVIHPSVFLRNPARSFTLVQHQRVGSSERQLNRYFRLLDILIGRAISSGIPEESEIRREVEVGLAVFPLIKETWRNYFHSIVDALQGNETSIKTILAREELRHSFCRSLLIGEIPLEPNRHSK